MAKSEMDAVRDRLDFIEGGFDAVGGAPSKLNRELLGIAKNLHNYIAKKTDYNGPVRMVLYCPSCGAQHVDEPQGTWTNPPHRSHLCHDCGYIWRPSDVPTVGVKELYTKGQADHPICLPHRAGVMDNYTIQEIFIQLSDAGHKKAADAIARSYINNSADTVRKSRSN